MRKMFFDDYIRMFRAKGKIPRIWHVADLRRLLKGNFSDNTIGVYPNNFSCTPDGLRKGDAVKRGMKPKYYRLGNGAFVLVDEYASDNFSQTAFELPSFENKLAIPETDSSTRRSLRRGNIEKRLFTAFPSLNNLLLYAEKCDNAYRKSSKSLRLYKEILSAHKSYGIKGLVLDSDFHNLIYRTLISWDMNNRRAKLVDFNCFSSGIKAMSTLICDLASYSMAELDNEDVVDIGLKIKDLFSQLKVMRSKSQIVGCSKALHFLLPQLIMPVDGKFTLNFLYGYRKYYDDTENEVRIFLEVFHAFRSLASILGIHEKDQVCASSWNTTVPKIIDNAIIGYTLEIDKSLKKRIE